MFLPFLMKNNEDFSEVTGENLHKHKNITHNDVQYIDDSNNSIGGANSRNLLNILKIT